jgi:hypothetical protein
MSRPFDFRLARASKSLRTSPIPYIVHPTNGDVGSRRRKVELLPAEARHLLPQIVGFGDYELTSNTLMSRLEPPELSDIRETEAVVRHREYIGDIVGTSSFTVQSFPINPGLQSSFPWLSQVAQAHEQYTITGLVYEYKPLSADFTTASSTALGYVIMATNYNSLDGLFPDKATMENCCFSNSGKPSTSFIHPIECKRCMTPVSELFVRTGNIPNGTDVRLYDLGLFQIATGGNNNTGVLGQLWATYEVVFYKARLSPALSDQLTDHYTLAAANITNVNPYGYTGTVILPNAGSSIGSSITSSTTLTLPSYVVDGKWLCIYQCVGTSAAVIAPTISLVNGTSLAYWNNQSTSTVSNTSSTTPRFILCLTFQVNVTTPGLPVSVTINTNGVLPSSPTHADVWLTQLSAEISN